MTTPYNTNLNERLSSYYDRVFDEQALSNASTTTSAVIDMAKVQSEVEFELTANNEITITDTNSLTVSYVYDKAADGSFSNGGTIVAYAASGGSIVLSADQVIANWTPSTDVEQFVKIVITVTEDQQAAKVDGQLYRTA